MDNIDDFPKQIKIGYYAIKIEYSPKLVDEDGEALMGDSNMERQLIRINTDYSEEQIKSTLHHEIMHLALDDTFVIPNDESGEIEENVIRVLSPKQMQIFTDNKKLTNFLFKKKRKKKNDKIKRKGTDKEESRSPSPESSEKSGTGSEEGNQGSQEGS